MTIRMIRTEAGYKSTLKEISSMKDSDPDVGMSQGDRLDVMVTLVQSYEAKHFPIAPPEQGEDIKFQTSPSGLQVKDLEPMDTRG